MIHARRPLMAVAPLAGLLTLWTLTPLATAQEWTRFRGPNGTGVSDAATVPTEWKEEDYNWRVELPGGGHSSPVLWGDRIFLTAADHDTAKRFVLCLSAADGRILWRKEYDSEIHVRHEYNSFASPTPAVDEEQVYIVWSTPEEYSLRAFTHEGKEVWHLGLGPYQSQHSCGASPIVFEDLVILPNDQDGPSSLVAVDRESGTIRWQVPRRTLPTATAYSTPCVYQPPGEDPELIFNSRSHGITAIDPKDGGTIWEVPDLFAMRTVSSPVIAGGVIIGTNGQGGGERNYVVAITPGSAGQPSSAQLAYKVEKSAPYVPTPVYKDGYLYLWSEGGTAQCVDAASGEVQWVERVGGKYFGSPVCIANRLYCMNTDGECVVLAASAEYEELARNPVGEFSHATPSVAGGVLYLRTFSHLISIGGK